MDSVNTSLVICNICGRSVALVDCTVDGHGKAVHRECYDRELATHSDETEILPCENGNDAVNSLPFANLVIPYLL
jgi:hypothetical protein